MTKVKTLEDVYTEIQLDPYWDSLRLPGINFVPGFGSRSPKAFIVGEAPGATENVRRRPFCGASGRVLDQLLELAGLCAEDDQEPAANAFITNVIKYRPAGNATPSIAEVMHAVSGYREPTPPLLRSDATIAEYERRKKIQEETGLREGHGSLRREWLALGGPSLIICVGGTAHSALSPMNFEGVSRWVNKPLYKKRSDGSNTWFISQFHPRYGMAKGPKVQAQIEHQWEEMGQFIREEGLL